jgi:hypothetical protein
VNDRPSSADPNRRWSRRLLAWLAHLYTAIGLLLAAAMGVFIVDGGAEGFRRAFICMLVACLVDATDGSLARRLHVKEVLPHFDGSKLDDLIDFLTFTSLAARLAPSAHEANCCLRAGGQCVRFLSVPAKTVDGYLSLLSAGTSCVLPQCPRFTGPRPRASWCWPPDACPQLLRSSRRGHAQPLDKLFWARGWQCWCDPLALANRAAFATAAADYDRSLAVHRCSTSLLRAISWGITIRRWYCSRPSAGNGRLHSLAQPP